jgi:hypothetical protein
MTMFGNVEQENAAAPQRSLKSSPPLAARFD